MKYNIYINVDNEKFFTKETNKSGLINNLLDKFYNATNGESLSSISRPKIIPTEREPKIITNNETVFNKFCKHGSAKGLCKMGCK